MPTDHGVGRSQSRRYSAEEKQAAVRMVRSLRAETGTTTGTRRRGRSAGLLSSLATAWNRCAPGLSRPISMRVPRLE
jgi:transposase